MPLTEDEIALLGIALGLSVDQRAAWTAHWGAAAVEWARTAEPMEQEMLRLRQATADTAAAAFGGTHDWDTWRAYLEQGDEHARRYERHVVAVCQAFEERLTESQADRLVAVTSLAERRVLLKRMHGRASVRPVLYDIEWAMLKEYVVGRGFPAEFMWSFGSLHFPSYGPSLLDRLRRLDRRLSDLALVSNQYGVRALERRAWRDAGGVGGWSDAQMLDLLQEIEPRAASVSREMRAVAELSFQPVRRLIQSRETRRVAEIVLWEFVSYATPKAIEFLPDYDELIDDVLLSLAVSPEAEQVVRLEADQVRAMTFEIVEAIIQFETRYGFRRIRGPDIFDAKRQRDEALRSLARRRLARATQMLEIVRQLAESAGDQAVQEQVTVSLGEIEEAHRVLEARIDASLWP